MKPPFPPGIPAPLCYLALIAVVAVLPGISGAFGQEQAVTESGTDPPGFTEQQLEFFENRVRPLLVERCYKCHGNDPDSLEGGLHLTSRELILAGGDSGPAIDLEHPDDSLLLSAVEYGDLFQMPPDSRLPEDDIRILRKWIHDGAAWPAGGAAPVVLGSTFDLDARRESHWCWRPVVRPQVPETGDAWALDPLDRFVIAKLAEHQLEPAAPASREVWIRRVTFDLTGLPPSPAEIDSFLADNSTQAFEKVVDRLLASPGYGEHWARHWMDLIRYAETCGHEFDYPIPNAWQYRDYLVRAFNADVPYDEFVVEHIAGDLVQQPRRNPDTRINESVLGTGFWFLGEATHGPVDVKGDEAGHVDNQIDVMGKTFLGLTVACARCHDHKFDAISAADYYAFSGFLQSSRRQDVMLDPDRKIETAWQAACDVSEIASGNIGQLVSQLESAVGPDRNRVPEYSRAIEAAILYLQSDRSWMVPGELKIEGESLKPTGDVAGKLRPQGITGWSGGAQVWWTDGSAGDSIRLQFEVPLAGTYDLVGEFTKAPDYGIIRVSLDEMTPNDPIDFYAESVSRSGEVELGSMDLASGTHTLQLTIVGKNEKAVPGYMAGIDYLLLRGRPTTGDARPGERKLRELADSHHLTPEQIAHWADAISDPATARPGHPFHAMRMAAESTVNLQSGAGEAFFRDLDGELAKSQNSPGNDTRQSEGQTASAPPLSQWKSTGFAFENPLTAGIDASDPEQPVITTTWTLPVPNSGRNGNRFQGVLRSPTFEIEHSHIHYLVKARNAKVRLIIDGFRLDVYNALLFGGMSIPLETDGQWQWVTQSGDLKNYIGHRAYIEVIDDGDGYVAIKAVEFSDSATPPAAVNRGLALDESMQTDSDSPETGAADNSNPLSTFAWSQARAIDIAGVVGFFTSGSSIRDDETLNWMLRRHLISGIDYSEVEKSLAELRLRMIAINEGVPDPVPAVGMTDGSPENEYVFIRGNHKNLGEEVARRPLMALASTLRWRDLQLEGSGRLELAKDLIRPDNPLLARVMVNRIWHYLTGRGVVASVDNFGVLGDRPTHPELLDYLASEFIDQGWSIKRLVRRIVLSQTYRMGSTAAAVAVKADPKNEFLHAFRVRRLSGEAIRDSMLAVSGELDLTPFGPPVPIHLTPFMQGRGRPGQSGPLDGNRRRSLYIEVRRNFLSPMMLAFDTPIPFNSIGRRNQSNVPAQALILLNDPFVIDQAEKWAQRLIGQYPDMDERIAAAIRAATGRRASAGEIREFREFVATQAADYGVSDREIAASEEVWTDVCHVIFNMKEFIFLN
jgi:hypothetical protein